MSVRLLVAGLAAAGGAWAQIDLFDLATTGAGASAYFATALARKGSGDLVLPGAALTRIYQVTGTGLQKYLERLPVYPAPVTVRGQIAFTNYFRLSHPETSRDGKVIAVTGARQCTGGDFCASQATLQTTITGLPGGPQDVAGAGRLSGSGRYLLVYSDGSLAHYSALVDLQTGQTTRFDWSFPSYGLGLGRVVADDGTAVAAAGSLWIARGGKVAQVEVTGGSAGEAVIDAAGQTVVYTLVDFGSSLRLIRSYRIADQRDSLVAALPDSMAHALNVSADGRRVMFLSEATGLAQIYTVNTDGSGLRQVSREVGGVQAAAMSDDGQVAWYFSGASRLYQMNLDTGEAQERMGRTPQLTFRMRMTAGSVYTLEGAGLSDGVFAAESYPLPRSLGGVAVAVNGMDAPLYSVSPAAIVLQAPWGTPQDANVEVRTSSTSPFEPVVLFADQILKAYGAFLPAPHLPSAYGGFDALAVHEDWSGPVTEGHPAHAMETIHLYGTGMGRVDAAQVDGMPAPANPPARTVVPVTCWAWGADNVTKLEIPVLFAGLAPGLSGYYQMDVRLPAANLRPSIQLACTGEDNREYFGSFAVAAR